MRPPRYEISIRPNCALSTRGAVWFFASVAAPTVLVAVACASLGYWPVLPFAGLELGGLALALRSNLQRRYRCQTIRIGDAEVEVEEIDRKSRWQKVFPRHWTRVKIQPAGSPLSCSRLFIESSGRSCEIGSFLNEQERRGLAERLARLIGRMNESPCLPLGSD
ncbi:MAG: DUF2244 domain-containing protein [Steroidobacteraceae bacterium]|nr:DUF2244 domain-containing protein [Steroidobacteraceae bacterium]